MHLWLIILTGTIEPSFLTKIFNFNFTTEKVMTKINNTPVGFKFDELVKTALDRF